jgi:predicted aspartyl protease
MPAFDATAFRPPAPVASVVVRSPESGVSVADVPMLIDTGADVSLLPREPVADLIDPAAELRQYELEAFDGARSWASVIHLEVVFLGKSFRGQFPLVDSPHGVIGRNILNTVSLVLDGPSLSWNEDR